MTSIVVAVDPALQEMANMRAPKRVGVALTVTMTCMAGAVIAQFAGPLMALVQEITKRTGPLATHLLTAGWLSAAVLLAVGAVASTRIAPRSESLLRAEWGRRRVALSLGLLLWAIAVVAMPMAFGWRPDRYPDPFVLIITTAWQLLAALAPLTGLRHLLSILGRRCRRWREARHGRQGIDSLVAAAGGVLVFSTAVPIMASYRLELLRTLALLLGVTSAAILVVGLLYLMMNALWITRCLIRPPGLLESYVEGTGPGERARG